MVRRRENTAREQFAILVAGRDHVLFGSFVHRQHILILVDDGIADDEHPVIAHAIDQVQKFVEAAVLPQCIEVLADMRFKDVEMPVDQLG